LSRIAITNDEANHLLILLPHWPAISWAIETTPHNDSSL